MAKSKKWYNFLWIWAVIYFALGFFNILFAWLGLIDFIVPLIFAGAAGNKDFCNKYCGRGQLFVVLGNSLKLSRNRPTPRFIVSKWFWRGFLAFFMTMFGSMIFQTVLVFNGAQNLRQAVKLFWTFRVPWKWAYTPGFLPQGMEWIAQFSYGFYSLMLTSTLIGLIVMLLYKPRTWCTFCPMGSISAFIAWAKRNKKSDKYNEKGAAA